MNAANIQEQLRAYGPTEEVLRELQEYLLPPFGTGSQAFNSTLPEDMELVRTWQGYLAEAQVAGTFTTLQRHIVQFRFPIRAGISQTDAYRRATLGGKSPEAFAEASGLPLARPDGLQLFLYSSPAGRLPVLVAPERADFVSLVQALCYRNEPHPIPASMGAVFIKGLNNWDRIRQLSQGLHSFSSVDLAAQREQYQDSLILLSEIPYSNVPARDMGLSEADWLRQSRQIRLAHEGAHYFTWRHFGRMHANMYDELIADYAGIRAVEAHFRADWFLRFIGLENHPALQKEGRLRNYLGQPPLSKAARHCLQRILIDAARQLETFDRQLVFSGETDLALRLWAICQHHLLDISAPDGCQHLLHTYRYPKALPYEN
ncbi:DUF7005 family protein [Haliscomenobacter hydrossis]|uniref:Uncharacterized protein n=1 Tax=Haliscomenobacter hydrossis (strain ATCC 27775 / DSM 1100 / LMG 10767 / O) TaxID=760192 RepID=F4L1M9_HALH1|nr:hypothetical protein [Haliscomenobacter hydrossis]AEE48573.1 hypothetical protein Halhy_0665 [Haliscomenobacter hydrossis DSM 1100]